MSEITTTLPTNAATHTPVGAPIEVRVTSDGDAALLVVLGHGSGIAASDRGRIFRRDVTLDRTPTGTA